MGKEAERHVQSVASALRILEAFDRDQGLTLKDLYERTGLNRSRILRFGGTLQAQGYLEFSEAVGRYTLGPKVFGLGRLVQSRYAEIANLVRPSLTRLAQASGDTAFYSVVQGLDRLVLAHCESTEGVRFVIPEGQVRPLYAGATGKVLLAFGPESLRRQILDATVLARLATPKSIDVEKLATDLKDIAAAGFAVSRGEATAHGFAVSVPVIVGGNLMGALSIAGPLTKLTGTLAESHVALLREEGLLMEPLIANIGIISEID
ncbi:IclR family transcriptional regulator [Taklimakanibacter lacteus]|uniref:IclR family transcriptional regulator n=1 Tax=Taklimakanibacter lacteus TaxID=2268456 RepID=UPI000E664864